MLKTITLSAVLAAILATTASVAFAAPRHGQTVVPQTGAEAFQSLGNVEDMGTVHRR